PELRAHRGRRDDDHDAADDQGDEDRQHGHRHRVRRPQLTEELGAEGRTVVGLRPGRDRGVARVGGAGGRGRLAHRASPSVLCVPWACPPEPCPPAINRPISSRGVSGETVAMIRPRYITAIRSDSAITSSSSLEISRTAVPMPRSCMIWLWMNSIDPTSTPRVGCEATNSFSGRDISRATMTFCWLPPDSELAGASADEVRMSNCVIRSLAPDPIAARSSANALPNGGCPYRSRMRFS